MIDASAPQSPGWWLNRLAHQLENQAKRADWLDSYYSGEKCAPPMATRAVREAYQRLMLLARTNFAELVVEAVRERMLPTAFRTGAVSDATGDTEAWRIWQANALDADSALVHRSQLVTGYGFVIVGGVDPDTGAPLITPEDPREVAVQHDPARRRKAVAGVKLFKDDWTGTDRAYLYLPGFVIQARRIGGYDTTGFRPEEWEWVTEPQRLPANVVPVVAFHNRADLKRGVQGEFESHVAILDRINYQILQRLEVATLQAFRQRAVKGLPDLDEQGNEIDYSDVFAADPGALWQLPETAEMWESGQVDLTPIKQAIRDDVQDLAAVTRTPLFYLAPDAANGSAEGASLAREGLVFKTQDRLVQAGESWEQVMSLAFTFAGDEQRARRSDLEIVWAAPERFSMAERYDAAAKAQAAGVPWSTVMSDVLQFSPQQIARMRTERAADSLLQASLFPQQPQQPTNEQVA